MEGNIELLNQFPFIAVNCLHSSYGKAVLIIVYTCPWGSWCGWSGVIFLNAL